MTEELRRRLSRNIHESGTQFIIDVEGKRVNDMLVADRSKFYTKMRFNKDDSPTEERQRKQLYAQLFMYVPKERIEELETLITHHGVPNRFDDEGNLIPTSVPGTWVDADGELLLNAKLYTACNEGERFYYLANFINDLEIVHTINVNWPD